MNERNMILKCKNFLDKEKTIFTMKMAFSLYIKCFFEKTGSLLRDKDGTLTFTSSATRTVPGISKYLLLHMQNQSLTDGKCYFSGVNSGTDF